MMTKSTKAVIGLFLLVAPALRPSPVTGDEPSAAAQLQSVVSEYDEKWLQLNPLFATLRGDHRYNDRLGDFITQEYLADRETLVREVLKRLQAIDATKLSGMDRVSYEVFRFERELDLEGFTTGVLSNRALLPVNQFESVPILVAVLGSGVVQPFRTISDYENWIRRSAYFAEWVDHAIANMRRGAEQRIVLPTVLVERTISVLSANTGEVVERSVFYKPITNLPDSIPADDARRLEGEYRAHIQETLVPAYRKLHDFMVEEYLPRSRPTVGIGALPGGQELYAYLVKQHTTTDLSPAQIHDIGKTRLRQLAREMEEIKERVGFEGTLSEFFVDLRTNPKFYYSRGEDLIAAYEAAKAKVSPRLPELFHSIPTSGYVIREVEPFRAPSAAMAQYFPGTPDGKRPGIVYVNTFKLDERPNFEVETISLHEAAPGHHFQISISQELEGMPAFRRFSDSGQRNAFIEGWGLYAESLGDELGMYGDPYQRLGSLSADAWRCSRLVVDTGMHAFGWTREEAIEFMKQATPMSEQNIVAEVERYIAIPGQALGYKIGQLKIRELRDRVESALGDEFDVRDFHELVLKTGAVPLTVLEQEVDRWLLSKSNGK